MHGSTLALVIYGVVVLVVAVGYAQAMYRRDAQRDESYQERTAAVHAVARAIENVSGSLDSLTGLGSDIERGLADVSQSLEGGLESVAKGVGS